MEMDKDSLYLALSQHDFYDFIQSAMIKTWNSLRNGDCTDEFPANSTTNFLSRIRCAKHKKHDRREPGLSKEKFLCTERFVCVAKHIAVTILNQTNSNLAARF